MLPFPQASKRCRSRRIRFIWLIRISREIPPLWTLFTLLQLTSISLILSQSYSLFAISPVIFYAHPASQPKNKDNANCIATTSCNQSRQIPIQLAVGLRGTAEFLTLEHIEFGMWPRSTLQRNCLVRQKTPYWQLANSRVRCYYCAMRGRDTMEYMILLPSGNKQSTLPPCSFERQSQSI